MTYPGANPGSEWYIYDVGGSRSMVCGPYGYLFDLCTQCDHQQRQHWVPFFDDGMLAWMEFSLTTLTVHIQYKPSFSLPPLLLIKFLKKILVSIDWYVCFSWYFWLLFIHLMIRIGRFHRPMERNLFQRSSCPFDHHPFSEQGTFQGFRIPADVY